MSKAKKIYIDYGSDSYKEGLSDGKEQGRRKTLKEVLKIFKKIWISDLIEGREFSELLEQKLKEVK